MWGGGVPSSFPLVRTWMGVPPCLDWMGVSPPPNQDLDGGVPPPPRNGWHLCRGRCASWGSRRRTFLFIYTNYEPRTGLGTGPGVPLLLLTDRHYLPASFGMLAVKTYALNLIEKSWRRVLSDYGVSYLSSYVMELCNLLPPDLKESGAITVHLHTALCINMETHACLCSTSSENNIYTELNKWNISVQIALASLKGNNVL